MLYQLSYTPRPEDRVISRHFRNAQEAVREM